MVYGTTPPDWTNFIRETRTNLSDPTFRPRPLLSEWSDLSRPVVVIVIVVIIVDST